MKIKQLAYNFKKEQSISNGWAYEVIAAGLGFSTYASAQAAGFNQDTDIDPESLNLESCGKRLKELRDNHD